MRIYTEEKCSYILYKKQKIILWNDDYIFINFSDVYPEDVFRKMCKIHKETDLGIKLITRKGINYITYKGERYMFNMNSQILLKRNEVSYAN